MMRIRKIMIALLLGSSSTAALAQDPQWIASFHESTGPASGIYEFISSGLDSQGNVIAISQINTNTTFLGETIQFIPFPAPSIHDRHFALVKFDSTGTLLWHKTVGCGAVGGIQVAQSVLSIDEEDRIHLYFSSQYPTSYRFEDSTMTRNEGVMFRLQADGAFDEVTMTLPSTATNWRYMRGHYYGMQNSFTFQKRSLTGAVLLSIPYNFNQWPRFPVYTVLADSSLVVAGSWPNTAPLSGQTIDGPVSNACIYAYRFDKTGELLWYRSYISDSPDGVRDASSIAETENLGVVIMARHVEPVTFAGQPISGLGTNGHKALFMFLDSSGTEVAGVQVASPSSLFVIDGTVTTTADGHTYFSVQVPPGAVLNGAYPSPNGSSIAHGRIHPQDGVLYIDFITSLVSQNARNGGVLPFGNGYCVMGKADPGVTVRTPCLADLLTTAYVARINDAPKPVPQIDYTLTQSTGDRMLLAVSNNSIDADSHAWTFDDGGSSTGAEPVHEYLNGGNYQLCYTATNACGSASDCQPVAFFGGFKVTPSRGSEGSVALVDVRGGEVETMLSMRLVRTGFPDVPFFGLEPALDPYLRPFLFSRVDLAGVALGLYDVELTLPDTVVTIANGFEVVQGEAIDLVMRQLPGNPTNNVENGIVQLISPQIRRAGLGLHTSGFTIRNEGDEIAFGVPIVSRLPVRGSTFYSKQYLTGTIDPADVAAYGPLATFRSSNGYGPITIPTDTENDHETRDRYKIRAHLLPMVQPDRDFRHVTAHGVSSNIDFKWIANHQMRAPVFGSRVLAEEYDALYETGFGEYVRLAAGDHLGRVIDGANQGNCFQQAEQQVLEFYARDIKANLENPKVYMISDVLGDILAHVLQSNCVSGFGTSQITPQDFEFILERAVLRFVEFPQVRIFPTPSPPLGTNVRPFPLVGGIGGSGFSGPVYGSIIHTQPVAEPAIPGLPSEYRSVFQGVIHGDGTLTGVASTRAGDGQLRETTISTAIDDGEIFIDPEQPVGEVVQQNENGAIRSDGIMRYLTRLADYDPEGMTTETVECLLDLTFDAVMSDAEFEAAYNACLALSFTVITLEELLNFPDAPDQVVNNSDAFLGTGCAELPAYGRKYEDLMAIALLPSQIFRRAVCGFFGFNCSLDPNEKYGPGDNDENIWVRTGTEFAYSITFENDPIATAPAQDVVVYDQIDTEVFDISTFRFGGVQVAGDVFIDVEGDDFDGLYLHDLRPRIDNILMLRTQVNEQSGLVTWTFRTLDTETMSPTEDAFAGFLPPNDTVGTGTGSVSFTIEPRNTVVSGDSLRNQAEIIFDVADPILTSVWLNILDDVIPASSVDPLPPTSVDPEFQVSWTGEDAVGVIDRYELYSSLNEGPFVLLGTFTGNGPLDLTGVEGSNYRFYTRAIDKAGNREAVPDDGFDTEITIIGTGIDEADSIAPALLCFPNPASELLTVVVGAQDPATGYRVFDASGKEVMQGRTNMAGRFDLNIRDLKPGMYAVQVFGDGMLGAVRFVKQ